MTSIRVSRWLAALLALIAAAAIVPDARAGGAFFDQYRTTAELSDYLDTLAALRPDIATVIPLATSHEGRSIEALRLRGPGDPAGRPAAVVIAGLNGAAWVGPMASCFALDQFVRSHGVNAEVTSLVNSIDWYFVVVANPDGHAYTQTDRLWRKNRRPTVVDEFGVNLNRNWGYTWGGAGSSGTPASQNYRGPSEMSEVETVALGGLALSLPNLRAVVEIDAFGQRIACPWGYALVPSVRHPEFSRGAPEIASRMSDVHGVAYSTAIAGELGQATAGMLHDWAHGVGNVLAWRIELRDTGATGYQLPADQIVPSGEEALAGLLCTGEIALRSLTLEFPSPAPTVSEVGQPAVVRVRCITWNNAELLPGSVKLLARVGSQSAYVEYPMSGGPTDFSAALPEAACGEAVEYFVRARTVGGPFITAPASAPSSVYSASVGSSVVLLDQNFERGPEWFTAAAASDGFWQAGLPLGGGDRADPPTDADGSGRALLTNPNDGNTDVDNGWVVAHSPQFSIPADGVIAYWYWFNTLDAMDAGDGLKVEVSVDPAHENWSLIRSYTTPDNVWRRDTIRIGDEVPSSATVQLRFTATDTLSGTILEAGIDGFTARQVDYCGDLPCPGDTNGDDAIDFADLNAVLSTWGLAGGVGDIAPAGGDGQVNFLDLNEVLSRWGIACP